MVKAAGDFGGGLDADDAVDFLAVFQDEQEGNGVGFEAGGGVGVFIHVEFGEAHPAGEVDGKFVEDRSDHPARPAPRSPKINEHRQRRAFDEFAECGVGDFDGVRGSEEWGFAAGADGREALRDFFRVNAVVRPAVGTAEDFGIGGRGRGHGDLRIF